MTSFPPPPAQADPARGGMPPEEQRRRLVVIGVVGGVLVLLASVVAAVALVVDDDGASAAVEACDEPGLRVDTDFVALAELTDTRDGLLPACVGDREPLAPLVVTFDQLSPPDVRDHVAYLGVFAADSDVVAFTQRLSGGRYVLAVQQRVVRDPVLRPLTIAHELAHVVVGDSEQYASRKSLRGDCATYETATGCLATDSILARWIDAFWSPEDIADVDLLAETEITDGDRRCAADASFLGAYGAGHPEEDLAEVVSAYVLDVDVPAAVQPRLDFVAEVPAFAAMRERARAHGLGPVPNVFEACGLR